MYKIFCDNQLICDSRVDDSIVINPVVTMEINTAGTFTFTFPSTHTYINAINRMTSVIRVERDDELVFQGFCIKEKDDMFGNKLITCEGELSYFNDSILRPARYQGETVLSLLTKYIQQHNAQVEERKQFEVGIVTVTDPNDYIYCYANMNSTMKELKEDLLDDYGGYMRVRYANGKKYIDYLAESTQTANQVIKLGENLLDYNSNIDDNKIATRVIPLGSMKDTEEIEGLPTRIDIKSVNNNKDYLESATAIENFGVLTKVVTFDNVHVPSILKAKGQKWLEDNQFENAVIEVKAFDLGYLGEENKFKLLDNIRVISDYHGMNRLFTLTKIQLNLNNPENDVYVLGKKQQLTLSAKTNTVSVGVNKVASSINVPGWLKQAKEQATALISGVDGGYVVLNVNDQGQPFELLVMDAPTKETARKVWRWNQNGFGYSSTGYNGTYGTAITMDGTIVADYIKAGVISGVEINNGNGTFRVDVNGNVTASSGVFNGSVVTVNQDDGQWLITENGKIFGGVNDTETGNIDFAFKQLFPNPDTWRYGIRFTADALALKGRIATTPTYSRTTTAPTVRNIMVDFENLCYYECSENGQDSTPHSFTCMNFVNGLLVNISDGAEYYPI